LKLLSSRCTVTAKDTKFKNFPILPPEYMHERDCVDGT
jgi:hypothetical protein